MRAAGAVVALLLMGCASLEGAESSALDRLGKTPIIIPIAKADWPPLCWHAPLLFWEKPTC